MHGPEDVPKNCSFPLRDRGPHLMHSSLGPPELTFLPNGISIGSAISAQQTDKHTDHATAVLVGRIYALRVCNEA